MTQAQRASGWNAGAPPIRCGTDTAGRMLYRIGGTPAALPPVTTAELADAWEAARAAALAAPAAAAAGSGEPAPRLFRFDDGTGPTDLVLFDREARCWADAVDRQRPLGTRGGLSLCLRLLGLIDLLARAPWARRFCVLRRDGAELDRSLLAAAARLPLTIDGRLDETGVRGATLGR